MKKEINFKNYLGDNKEIVQDLKELLLQEGKCLFISPTGSGKTNVMSFVFKELSTEHKDKLFVIACPNRGQNIQNQSSYDLFAVVGGKQLPQGLTTMSMVYDKAKAINGYATKEGKKVVLVIDEAHQLIDSQFRKQALKDLNELSKVAITTIHLTATPRKLLELYEYDNVIKCTATEDNHNIGLHTLMTIEEDSDLKLIDISKDLVSKKYKPLIFLNDLDLINILKVTLEDEGLKVGVACSKDNEKKIPNNNLSEIFASIENTEMLPTNYDVFFTTSVLECGVNLKNTDIVPISYITKSDLLDLDSLEQQFARARNKIDMAFTIIKKADQVRIACKESIFKTFDNKVKRRVEEIKQTKEQYNLCDDTTNQLLHGKDGEDNKVGYGCIYCENGEIKVNEEMAIKQKFRLLDSQYYYNYKELNEVLKAHIKADKFIIANYTKDSTETAREGVKVARDSIKKSREEEEKQTKDILTSMIENKELMYLYEYLLDEDTFSEMPKPIKEKIKVLEVQDKILKNIKDMVKVGISIENAIDIILKAEKKKDITDFIREFNYKDLNNKGIVNYNATDEYNLVRRELDEVMQKRGRLTKNKMIDLYESLVQYKHLKPNKKDNVEEKKLSEISSQKLLKTFNLIYNISTDKQGIRINSLKT